MDERRTLSILGWTMASLLMAIFTLNADENGMTVNAITGKIGDVVLAIDHTHAPADGLDRIEQYRICDVLGLVTNFAFELHSSSPSFAYETHGEGEDKPEARENDQK